MTGQHVGPTIYADPWSTAPLERNVLLIVHNVTTITRLLDIIPAFDNDPRIGLFITSTPSDPFRDGAADVIAKLGIPIIRWAEAVSGEFGLAISASHHDGISDINSPLVILSHGIGYTKYSPRDSGLGTRDSGLGTRDSGLGTRDSGLGTRDSGLGTRDIFGLSRQWVLRGGQPFAQALVLSHHSQLEMLARSAPEAYASAVVAGDPCYDRIVAGVPFRGRYRRALGIGGRTAVFVSSTWSTESALGARFDLVRELLAELPRDSFAILTAPHPNIRYRHGPGTLAYWFADCLRSGMIILPEIDGWRAGLIAADVVIGDHGAVTGYGAAIGRPTLLATFTDVPPGTAIHELGGAARRLPPHGPYREILESAAHDDVERRFSRVEELVTSEPGRSLELLRSLFYRILGLEPPPTEVPVPVPPAPHISPGPSETSLADDVVAVVDSGTATVQVVRRPAEVQRIAAGVRRTEPGARYLCCGVDYPIRTLRARAQILLGDRTDLDADEDRWFGRLFDTYSSCRTAALVGEDRTVVTTRSGRRYAVSSPSCPPGAAVSALHALICAGTEAITQMTVLIGGTPHAVHVEAAAP